MQNWGGRPSDLVITEELPLVFQKLILSMVHSGIYPPEIAPNHVLVNEYRDGCGIMPHEDGETYSPQVAIITLSGSALLSYTSKSTSDQVDLYLPRRSLQLSKGPVYTEALHGIQKSDVDIITPTCVNAQQLNLQIGDLIARPNYRVSLVFVHKIIQK